MRAYPVTLTPDRNGTIVATFADVPEAVTVGNTEAEALKRSQDALVVALSGYIDGRRDIPRPSRPRSGQRTVAPPPMAAAKLAIYQTMRDQGLDQADLAERLGSDAREVRRLLDLDHNSRLDHLEAALAALGKRLVVEVQDAA